MLKKRLIYTLLLQDGIIQLSRNFSLQAVGNIEWLYKYYNFDSIAYSVDELVLLNVSRGNKNTCQFARDVIAFSKKCYMPLAVGGGITCLDDAYKIMDAGADKLIINTALFDNPDFVTSLVKIFGSQCIVASIDYRHIESNAYVFSSNGLKPTGLVVEDAVRHVEQLGVGEIYLTSMDRDGTGQGLDVSRLCEVVTLCRLPVIASGGVGDYGHFIDGMRVNNISGVSTANIFNFIGDGLTEARKYIIQNGIELAEWDFSSLQS